MRSFVGFYMRCDLGRRLLGKFQQLAILWGLEEVRLRKYKRKKPRIRAVCESQEIRVLGRGLISTLIGPFYWVGPIELLKLAFFLERAFHNRLIDWLIE